MDEQGGGVVSNRDLLEWPVANGDWVNDQRTWGRPGRNSLAGKQRDVKRIGVNGSAIGSTTLRGEAWRSSRCGPGFVVTPACLISRDETIPSA